MNVAAFASYVFLTAATPGPNNIMAMTNSGRLGFKKTLRFCFGVMIGVLIDMILCASFTFALFEYIPAIEPYMKWLGTAYILFLAYTIVRDKPHGEKRSRLRPESMLTGALMQFVNVKVILYGITIFSTFILPYYRSVPVLAMVVILLTMVSFMCTCGWAVFGSLLQGVFNSRRKLLNAVMALLLVYCAIAPLVR